MKATHFIIIALMVGVLTSCKKEKIPTDFIDFEEINLGVTGYRNGSDGSGGFSSGNAFFRTVYDSEWQVWSGFAVSNHTDKHTPGYENQYSSIAGKGTEGSSKYAVLYSFDADTIAFYIPERVTNISLCNSAYAYYSMLNGDLFSVKYGGESGNEQDYFQLIIKGVNEDGMETGTFLISLADFRNIDGVPDFIGNMWTNIDLSPLGFVKYLIFSFDSSKKNEWGIITPTYVCIDNIRGELLE